MTILYQKRGTGKSTSLILQSYESGLPIATYSQKSVENLLYLAKKILPNKPIPKPFVATPEKCKSAGKYLVDEGAILLQNLLGGEIVLMTISEEDEPTLNIEDKRRFNEQ